MICSACGHENRAAAKFCEECGSPIPTGIAPTKVEARKVVTIVFADLIGSTSLHERLDPESVSRVMESYHRSVRVPVEAHGGTVVQLLGDGVMCAFGVPRVSEDDAIRAVRAAVGIQQAFREFARQHAEWVGNVGLRVAVNTGEVVVSDDYQAGIGDPLNVAARLQQEARDGDVLIGESTQRLVHDRVTLEPFGVFRLKGRAESVACFRVVSLERPPGVPATPFVGRENELRRILAVFDSTVAEHRPRMALILGSPGLGKSRLIDEVCRRLADPSHEARPRPAILTAQCDAARGATFAPIAEALRRMLAAEDANDERLRTTIEAKLSGDETEKTRIADGIGALLGGKPAPPEETFFVVRRFLASLAATQPVVLVIDDLQWAEPLLLDLTEHLVQWSSGSPLFLLLAARPELRDVRSSLAVSGGSVDEVVTIGGLDASAATQLAASIVGADQLPAAIAGRVLAASEGNPLFVGELVRMLVQGGTLRLEDGRWTAGAALADVEMPPTIHAVLAARIESLRPEERMVLERAAVVGRHFSRTAVTQLLPRDVTDLDLRLEALRRSELIEPARGRFIGEPVLRFHHVLIRDAAYRRLLKETRAELHGRLADWIESRVGDSTEHDETIGRHLEQAHQNLRELGPLDEHGRAFGERAARCLARAGRRALARDDLPLAASLLGRAIDRLDAGDPTRANLALDWCEALLSAGDVGPAAAAVAELAHGVGAGGQGSGTGVGVRGRGPGAGVGKESQRTGSWPPAPGTYPGPPREDGRSRLRAWHTCFAAQLAVLTDPQALHSAAEAVASAAEEFAALGDDAGEAKAHAVHATILARLGKIGTCEMILDRALAAARRAGDRRRANAVLAEAPVAALWGPSPVTRASGRCLDVVRVLRITQGSPAVEAVALRCQAVLEALRCRTDAARRMIASSRQMLEELGITQRLLETDVAAGRIELIDGDPVAAERCLRAAYEGLRAHGLTIDAAQAAALLARALLMQNRDAEAEALSHESETLAGDDLTAAIAWRGVRAEALARRGQHATALDLARAAVHIAEATDALLDHADARVALATSLRAAGRNVEADEEARRALELWKAKGATVLAERSPLHGTVQRSPMNDTVVFESDESDERDSRGEASASSRMRETLTTFAKAVAARDWERCASVFAPDFVVRDHRRMGSETLRSRDEYLSRLRTALDAAPYGDQVLTLNASGALTVGPWIGGGQGGAFTTPAAHVIVADAGARISEWHLYDLEQLEEARACYRSLTDEPSAALTRAFTGAFAERNWDDLARLLAPDLVVHDHRVLGWETLHGPQAYIRALQSLVDLSPDVRLSVDRPVQSGAEFLYVATWRGSHEGGPFESPSAIICEVDESGRIRRFDQHDIAELDNLKARFRRRRFEEMRGNLPPTLPNAASRLRDRINEAFLRQDWQAMRALAAAGMMFEDRRTMAGTSGGVDLWIKAAEAVHEASDLSFRDEVLAALGDRVELRKRILSGRGPDGGVFEVEFLVMTEIDADGRLVASINFEAGSRDEALAETRRRALACEARLSDD